MGNGNDSKLIEQNSSKFCIHRPAKVVVLGLKIFRGSYALRAIKLEKKVRHVFEKDGSLIFASIRAPQLVWPYL